MVPFPVGKLPAKVLERLLSQQVPSDPRVLLGPGLGLDCAVIDCGETCLVIKSDPITFTARELGWYAVHVNANDIATTGAQPKWFTATLLLPENGTDDDLVDQIFQQIRHACSAIGAELVGGHTEITAGLDRPILAGSMLGEVRRDRLITPKGARPGDALLLTKGVPIEGTSILAHEFRDRLKNLPGEVLARAEGYLHDPGISVVREALTAARTGGVSAMHDPTEGGLASGLWELARAAGVGILVDEEAIFVPSEARAVCSALDVNPLEAIASGALLLAVRPESAEAIQARISDEGIAVARVGSVVEGDGVAMRSQRALRNLPWPKRDAIAALFQAPAAG